MRYFLVAVVSFLLGIEYNEWRWQMAARRSARRWLKENHPEIMEDDNGR